MNGFADLRFDDLHNSANRLLPFQSVGAFQKEQPDRLLGVVEFRGASGLFPENVGDIFEGLFTWAQGSGNVSKCENADWMIAKMSGFSTRYPDVGREDSDFSCPTNISSERQSCPSPQLFELFPGYRLDGSFSVFCFVFVYRPSEPSVSAR